MSIAAQSIDLSENLVDEFQRFLPRSDNSGGVMGILGFFLKRDP